MPTEYRSPADEAIVRFARGVLRLRWLIILLTLAVVGLCAAGLPRIRVSDDYKIYYEDDDPHLLAMEALENKYTKTENLIIAVVPKGGDIFTPEALAVLQEVTEEAWHVPNAIRVDSLTNFQHTEARGDELIVGDFIPDPASLSPDALERLKQLALSDSRLVNSLVSPAGRVAGVSVSLQLDRHDSGGLTAAVAKGRELESYVDNLAGFDAYLTGNVVMNVTFREVSEQDNGTLIPIMVGGVIVVMLLLLRSIGATFGAFLVVGFSAATAQGFMGWAGIPATPVTTLVPLMLMVIAVADSVHIIIRMFEEMRQGTSKSDAIVESLRVNLSPVFLTSLTTSMGFLGLNFSDSPPFQDLGNIVALGVAAAFVYSVTFLPAALSLLPIRKPRQRVFRRSRMVWLADFIIPRQRPILWISSLVVLFLIACIPLNEINDDFVKYFDESVPFRADTEYISRNLAGSNRLDYNLGAGGSGGIADPAYLRVLDNFAIWFREQDHVMHVDTITETMKHLNKSLHGGDPAYFKLPDTKEVAAQFLLLYEMSLPYGLDLNNQIDVDKSATRFVAVIEPVSTREMQRLVARADAWLRENAPAHMYSYPVGPAVMFAFISQRNIITMLFGTAFVLIFISGLLVLAFRSVRLGIISLVPNLIPATMAFGLWGLLVGEVGLGVSAVSAMSLGIVVDDTVHFLSKYLRARRERGLPPEGAVRFAFESVGAALVTTSLILMAGFLLLSLSAYYPNGMMGQLTALVIGCALVADFFLLPVLLIRFDDASTAQQPVSERVAEPEGAFAASV